MNVLPLIARELREQSRRASTYWLRLPAAFGLMVAVAVHQADYRRSRPQGGDLFDVMQLTLMVAVWILVPLMAADCISQERRSGTLGLLFLTPLKFRDVILAKAAIVFIRSLKILVAAIPVLAIPFLMGGVSWDTVMISLATCFSALLWMLAIGILSSSVSRSLSGVSVKVTLAVISGVGMFVLVLGWNVAGVFPRVIGSGISVLGLLERGAIWLGAPSQVMAGNWAGVSSRQGEIVAVQLALSALAALLLLAAAAFNIHRHWREEPPSAARLKLQKTFTLPRYGAGFLRRRLRRKLSRNPVGWLQQRSWKGRVVLWSWLTWLLVFYGWMLTEWRTFASDFSAFQYFFAVLFLASVSLSAAGSFSQERECGALELILVTPLSNRRLIRGRLLGIWTQFLPALALMMAVWVLYFCTIKDFSGPGVYYRRRWSDPEWVAWFEVFDCGLLVLGFLLLPMIGLYWSMSAKHPFVAVINTFAMSFLLPWGLIIVGDAIGVRLWHEGYLREWGLHGLGGLLARLLPTVVMGTLAFWLWRRLNHLVAERRFMAAPRD